MKISCLSDYELLSFSDYDKEAICHRMALVCGTSTCHMAVSQSKLFIPGIWGPFWSGNIWIFVQNVWLCNNSHRMHECRAGYHVAYVIDIGTDTKKIENLQSLLSSSLMDNFWMQNNKQRQEIKCPRTYSPI